MDEKTPSPRYRRPSASESVREMKAQGVAAIIHLHRLGELRDRDA